MLFADDIVLVAETREEVNNKIEELRAILKGSSLPISCTKTKIYAM